MNKIYRRLWSTARQCWIVASELATAGKASGEHRIACITALPLVLVASLLVPQTAKATIFWGCDKENGLRTCFPFIGHDGEFKGADATWASSYYMMMGNGAFVDGSYVTGYGHQIKIHGSDSTGFGYGVNIRGDSSTAIGYRAEVKQGYSTILGARAVSDGIGSVSVGNRSSSSGENGIAVGSNARNALGAGNSRIAIGGNSYAGSSGYTGAVALGGESRAEYDGTALGHAAKATAVRAQAFGRNATASHTDSVALGANSITTGTNQISVGNNSQKRKIVNLADGALNASSGEAVTGRQLYATSRMITQNSASGGMRIGVDNSGNQIGIANSRGEARYLNGVRNGTLSSTSTDAVTGQQLFATHQRLDKVDGLVNQTAQNGSIRIGSANTGGALTISNKDGELRYLNGVRNGTISATSHDAVTGQQLFAVNKKVDPLGRTIAAGGGIADADRADASGTGTLAIGGKAVAKATHATAAGYDAQATANQATAIGRQSRATGIFSTAVGNNALASAESALALGDRAEAGHDRSVALGRQSVTTGSDQVSVGNAGLGLKRKIVNMEDGTLNTTSADAVTGKQLFATNKKVEAGEALLALHSGDLAAHSGWISDNRRDLDSLRAEFEDFDPDLEGVVKFSPDGSVDVAGGKLRNVAAGDISSAASMDAVNGGQLFAANQRIAGLESEKRFFAVFSDDESDDAIAGRFSLAIGDGANAGSTTGGATAIGFYANASARNSIALGSSSLVSGDAEYGFALGAASEVHSRHGLSLGAGTQVISGAEGSVALGSGSIAHVRNVISVGSRANLRRIINVAQGQDANDATTVVQLDGALRQLGGGAHLEGGNVVPPRYDVQGSTQNNVGDALAALDSAVVATDSRVDGLEGKLRSAFQDGPSMRADGLNQLALAGAQGSVLTNLAEGRIVAGSRDAVTGSQLFEAKQEIARNRGDLDELRGERDELLSRGLMAAEQGHVIDFGGARLTGAADGVISADSRDVVSGKQLFATNSRVEKIDARVQYMAMGEVGETTTTRAGAYGLALGAGATAALDGEGGVAVGAFSHAGGVNSVALGRAAIVRDSVSNGFAVGTQSLVSANGGIAIGARSRVDAGGLNSVALGWSSVANEANTLSVGHASLQRRIVNVANGRNANDATTVGQLRSALATLGGDIDANGNIISPNFNVQGGQQSTLNEALSTIDAAVVTNTTRTNRVESQLNAVFQDSPTVRNDGLNQLTFAGANGMVLSNVANGAIAAGSRDAVNGGQLHSMQQQLNGRMDGLENRIDSQPQSRAMTVASADTGRPAADDAPPSTGGNPPLADAGNAPKSAPQPQAGAPKPESPKPQVDTAELEKMLARANEYSDGISREVDRRLDKMDKRFNRMAAMTSAQSAMAMNTAGLNTYNRLGAGVGYSEGESAMAVGYQRVLNDKGSATFSLNGAFTNSGERSMGVGVGIGW